MLPSDLELVNLVAALYAPPPGLFDAIIQVNSMAPYIGVKHLDGYDVVIARGSKTAEDWLRDAISEEGHIVPGFEALGLLPDGFAMHITDSYAETAKELRPGLPTAFAGHSLAAPEALYLGGAHIIAGGNFARAAIFEPPNPGTQALTAFYAGRDVSPWWNAGDFVPYLPEPILLSPPWQPVRPARRFNIAPPPGDKSPLPRHSIALCQQAVAQAQVSV